ncbi:MAG: hypothetical protein COC15_03675 [Legionellales bacterium]|nr:MAG: hypothetical protein COC15_03675 [Legionellales bacterium]
MLLLSLLTGMAQADGNIKPIPVTTVKLSAVLTIPNHSVPATAISLNDSTISSEIFGKIIRILPQVGDVVQRGDKLVALECTDHSLP